MGEVTIWGRTLPVDWFTPECLDYLHTLPDQVPAIEWVWNEMDGVWRTMGLDNTQPLQSQRIDAFYQHPVWIMNGLFTMVDDESVGHRTAIANELSRRGCTNIADYGGGFGELAMALARVAPRTTVDLIEPYPSRPCRLRVAEVAQIRFKEQFDGNGYDAVVAQDVLEHVEDPVDLARHIAAALRPGGVAIFANCFLPVIQCHLPATFHLRHTFKWVMGAMGLDFVGTVEGARHAQMFERRGPIREEDARRAERLSKVVGPLLNVLRQGASRVKRFLTGR